MSEQMSYSDAADILEAHNAWRRGQNDDTETPSKWRPEDTQMLVAAIDVAVDGLRKLQEENRELRGGLERAIHRANGMPLRLRKLINDDGFAASFQTIGQYRTALMRDIPEIAKTPNTDRKP